MRVSTPFPLRSWRILFTLLLLIGAACAHAQSADEPANDANDPNDPPSRVAQLAYADGDLGLMPAGSTTWTAADVNHPLTDGDKLSSGPGGRAELDLGGASLRINGQSDVGILNLNGQIGQFELTQGTLNITVRSIDQGASYEIDTPVLAVVIDQPGRYRVDVPVDGGSTTVAVNDGLATVYGENNAQREVFAGRRYQFNNSSLGDVVVSDITGSDAFDLWCSDRDTQEGNDASAQYVSDDMVGGDDLDGWGSWEQDQDYGAVWYPVNVVTGWAPYRFGHWVWIAPWGWTWVDDLPWGFAPYHYGRWAFIHNRWGWIPGPRFARPIYAPALVAFMGGRRGYAVGWFPLGPHDVYNPWYRASRNYYTGVNLANLGAGRYYDQTQQIEAIRSQYALYRSGRSANATYAYRNTNGAVTAVSEQTFTGAGSVRNSQVRLSAQQLAATSVVSPEVLQHPASTSYGQPRLIDARPLPAAGFNRQVVAVGRPSAAIAATASVRAGQPASNVRVLSVHPSLPVISHAQVVGNAEVVHAPRNITAPPAQAPAEEQAVARPAMLPQVPHFEPAQQVQSVEQAERYQPAVRAYAPREEDPQQQRFQAAERSHQYVPEQRQPMNINPSYQPYARPDAVRPEQQARSFSSETHPQSASHPHESAPAPSHPGQH
jgi:hypothetical protein